MLSILFFCHAEVECFPEIIFCAWHEWQDLFCGVSLCITDVSYM